MTRLTQILRGAGYTFTLSPAELSALLALASGKDQPGMIRTNTARSLERKGLVVTPSAAELTALTWNKCRITVAGAGCVGSILAAT